jgi:CYTH domain-containing protein
MSTEIERRFLVQSPGLALAVTRRSLGIIQGYFGRTGGFSVRVRAVCDPEGRLRAYLTFKGPKRGLSRLEYEYEIDVERARRALRCLPARNIIRKTRYEVPGGDQDVWWVDRFHGPNEGLVLAEVELERPDQPVQLPSWLGQEVSYDRRFSNSNLARAPMPAGAIAAYGAAA